MAKLISMFNHKGGVSKTTTAFNLGWMLAKYDKKVLLVDCDPQCNLTGMVLGLENVYSSEEIQSTEGKPPRNIKDGLAPAFEAQPSLIQHIDCAKIPGNPNLFLMPGHIGLAEYEVTLGIAQELSGSLTTLRNLPGSLHYLINKTAEKYAIDIVVIDMSPSLGPINQNLLSISDYFIVPMQPDYFSTMAINSLAKVIPKWRDWAQTMSKQDGLKEAEYPFPQPSSKFLGYIVQNYRPRKGVPAKAFGIWFDQLGTGVNETLLPALERCEMLRERGKSAQEDEGPIGPFLQMPDFNSLIAKSQEYQVPIFELTQEQMGQVGAVYDATKKSQDNFRTLFKKAATDIIGWIDEDSA